MVRGINPQTTHYFYYFPVAIRNNQEFLPWLAPTEEKTLEFNLLHQSSGTIPVKYLAQSIAS